jgi:hypothetical protein
MKKSMMLAAVALILVSMSVQSALACTTRTPGYWKTHGPDSRHPDWPTSGTVTVGADDFVLPTDADDLLAILWARPRGDAWIILAQKVVAAQLSMLRYPSEFFDDDDQFGGYDDGMVGMVDDANDLLAAAGSYPPGSDGRADVTDLASTIDFYLNYWDEYDL